jgi:hypothetical protein
MEQVPPKQLKVWQIFRFDDPNTNSLRFLRTVEAEDKANALREATKLLPNENRNNLVAIEQPD